MWPFRRSQTQQDGAERHSVTLDLIEQVAALRGQVRAMETEWDDIREQIKKGYQRIEKANQRASRRLEDEDGGNSLPDTGDARTLAEPPVELRGFAKKLAEIRGA